MMNTWYIKPAARLVMWGLALFAGGAAVSGFLSILGVTGTAASDASQSGIYFAIAVVFGTVSLLGFVLLLTGVWRIAHHIDQRYEPQHTKVVNAVPVRKRTAASQPESRPAGELERLPLKQAPQTLQNPSSSRLPGRRLIIVIS